MQLENGVFRTVSTLYYPVMHVFLLSKAFNNFETWLYAFFQIFAAILDFLILRIWWWEFVLGQYLKSFVAYWTWFLPILVLMSLIPTIPINLPLSICIFPYYGGHLGFYHITDLKVKIGRGSTSEIICSILNVLSANFGVFITKCTILSHICPTGLCDWFRKL